MVSPIKKYRLKAFAFMVLCKMGLTEGSKRSQEKTKKWRHDLYFPLSITQDIKMIWTEHVALRERIKH